MAHVVLSINSALTLYMMLILLRWVAPWLELDLYGGRLRWIPAVVDPLIVPIRRMLPAMGPLDFGPLAALFVVLIIRFIAVPLSASVLLGQAP
jgi:YggT family protein